VSKETSSLSSSLILISQINLSEQDTTWYHPTKSIPTLPRNASHADDTDQYTQTQQKVEEQRDWAGDYPVDRIGALGLGRGGREVVTGAEHVIATEVEDAGASDAAAGDAARGCAGAGRRGARVLAGLLEGEEEREGRCDRQVLLGRVEIEWWARRRRGGSGGGGEESGARGVAADGPGATYYLRR
jgi:hypothetical protein